MHHMRKAYLSSGLLGGKESMGDMGNGYKYMHNGNETGEVMK